jgi:hypothetical protein
MRKLAFNVVDAIFRFGSLKKKPHKVQRIMPHLKLSKTQFLDQRN